MGSYCKRHARCNIRMVQVGLLQKIWFEQKHKGGERVIHGVWESPFQAEGTARAKAYGQSVSSMFRK